MSFWQPSIALWWWVLAIGNVIRGVVMGEDSVSGVTGTVSESALLKSDNMFTTGPTTKKKHLRKILSWSLYWCLLVVCLHECGIYYNVYPAQSHVFLVFVFLLYHRQVNCDGSNPFSFQHNNHNFQTQKIPLCHEPLFYLSLSIEASLGPKLWYQNKQLTRG